MTVEELQARVNQMSREIADMLATFSRESKVPVEVLVVTHPLLTYQGTAAGVEYDVRIDAKIQGR